MSFTDDIVDRSWIHSHEEDSGDETTYRPASFAFPPSRGRHGFALRSDGTAVLMGPDPGDRAAQETATWQIENADSLVLRSSSGDTRVLQVKSVSPDKLVVKQSG